MMKMNVPSMHVMMRLELFLIPLSIVMMIMPALLIVAMNKLEIVFMKPLIVMMIMPALLTVAVQNLDVIMPQ